MSREEYIAMRNSSNLNVQLLFSYFVKNGGDSNYNMFMMALRSMDISSITKHLDKEFSLSILSSKEGTFIKAY